MQGESNHCAWEKALYKLVHHKSGEKRHNCAVVIPSSNMLDALDEHLRRLARQTTKNFDIIVIGDPPKKIPARLNVITFSERYPLGSSGGFGIGQVLAYTQGYEYIINSDADAMPIAANLVERLLEYSKNDPRVLMPLASTYEDKDGEKRVVGYAINQYAILRRQVLDKIGFQHFRFFKGADDSDYIDRLRMENMVRILDNCKVMVEHTSPHPNFISGMTSTGNKFLYYKKTEVIGKILLANYTLWRGDLLRSAAYIWKAWWMTVKTQMFYFPYQDITKPVLYEAIFLDTRGIRSVRHYLQRVQLKKGMKCLLLSTRPTKANEAVLFEPKDVLRRRHFFGYFYTLGKLLEILQKEPEYVEPSDDFIENYSYYLPLLLLFVPVKYRDGMAYFSGVSLAQVAINFVKTLVVAPFFLLIILRSTLMVKNMNYPITPQNLKVNLEEFYQYVKSLGD